MFNGVGWNRKTSLKRVRKERFRSKKRNPKNVANINRRKIKKGAGADSPGISI